MCGVVKISSVIPQQATINEIASYSESTAADHASPMSRLVTRNCRPFMHLVHPVFECISD